MILENVHDAKGTCKAEPELELRNDAHVNTKAQAEIEEHWNIWNLVLNASMDERSF